MPVRRCDIMPNNDIFFRRIGSHDLTAESDASDRAEIDMTVGKRGIFNTGAFKGLNALSRGQAYYHRPGSWKEHPNFFNPFWRAKLAPVGEKLIQLQTRGLRGAPPFLQNMLGTLGRLITDEIIIH